MTHSAESQHLEWKESWRDEYLKWVCAFANTGGGTLVVGRNDAGTAVGVRDAARLLEDLPNKIRNLLGLVVPVGLRRESGLDLIEIEVEASPYPVTYRGKYYVRSGSTTQELSGAPLDAFLLRMQGRHWDGVPLPRVGPADLSAAALARFRTLAGRSGRVATEWLDEPDATLLERLRLTDGAYLKRAAALLFHPDPEAFVGGAWIKVGAFGDGDADLRFQDEVHGPLLLQVEAVVELLKAKYLKAPISYQGLQRIETLAGAGGRAARGAPERRGSQGLCQQRAHSDQRVPGPPADLERRATPAHLDGGETAGQAPVDSFQPGRGQHLLPCRTDRVVGARHRADGAGVPRGGGRAACPAARRDGAVGGVHAADFV